MDAKTYTHITPQKFAKVRSLLEAQGQSMPPGNDGVIKNDQFGVHLAFSYDGTDALTLKIEKKPFLVPSSVIWNQLEKAFQQNVAKA